MILFGIKCIETIFVLAQNTFRCQLSFTGRIFTTFLVSIPRSFFLTFVIAFQKINIISLGFTSTTPVPLAISRRW